MVVEVAGGLLSGSLALLADAGHMLTDSAALALAWLAHRAGRLPADEERSYGYHRAQVLAALINGGALLLIVGWVMYEAVSRLLEPREVLGGTMLAIAVAGLVVNVVAYRVLHGGERHNINVRGALLHVLGDILGSLAAIVAAMIILATGWMRVDPLLSILVAMLILRSAWGLVQQSIHILLEGTPEHIEVAALREALKERVPSVQDVHHVHAWSLTPERPLLTLHVQVDGRAGNDELLCQIKSVLAERFHVYHSTVQIERRQCADVEHAPCPPG